MKCTSQTTKGEDHVYVSYRIRERILITLHSESFLSIVETSC